MILSMSLQDALETVSRLLAPTGARWLIGGSTGLLLQQVELGAGPRDLDLYVDEPGVALAYEALRAYAVDMPLYSETPIYASILSHYEVAGAAVELVGAFRVESGGSLYRVEADYLWERWALDVPLAGGSRRIGAAAVKLMPLAHELLFNVLRDRADRYVPIAEAMLRRPGQHMPVLKDLLARGRWDEALLGKLNELRLAVR